MHRSAPSKKERTARHREGSWNFPATALVGDAAPTTIQRSTSMAPRKTILRELTRRYEETGTKTYTRPTEIHGFSDRPDKYQKAVNDLLQARLVEGQKDAEGRMAIAVNEHRLGDVRREIRPVWMHPAAWVTVVIALAVVVGFFGG